MQLELGKAPNSWAQNLKVKGALTIIVKLCHFINEKNKAREVNDLPKSPGKEFMDLGQEFRLSPAPELGQCLIKSNTYATEVVALTRILTGL